MEYTLEQLELMEDFYINKIAAHLEGWDVDYWNNLPDFCNDQSVGSRLILDSKISINANSNGEWSACNDDGIYTKHKENPLRAVAVCYILVKQEENMVKNLEGQLNENSNNR